MDFQEKLPLSPGAAFLYILRYDLLLWYSVVLAALAVPNLYWELARWAQGCDWLVVGAACMSLGLSLLHFRMMRKHYTELTSQGPLGP